MKKVRSATAIQAEVKEISKAIRHLQSAKVSPVMDSVTIGWIDAAIDRLAAQRGRLATEVSR